jgi:Bacteriophage tail sheath protein
MPEYLAPGVYVEEVSFRSKSIEGVSTSTAGYVGAARYGPFNGIPELVTSFAEFERVFGGLDQLTFEGEDATHNYLAHAVRAFFDNGGRRVYISRIYQPGERTIRPHTSPPGAYDDLDLTGHATAVISTPAGDVFLVARYPGSGGNFRVSFLFRVSENVRASKVDPDVPGKSYTVLKGVEPFDLVWVRNTGGTGKTAPGQLYWAERFFDDSFKRYNWRLWPAGSSTPLTLNSVSGNSVITSLAADQNIHRVTATVEASFLDADGVVQRRELWESVAFHYLNRRSIEQLFQPEPPTRNLQLSIPFVFDGNDLDGAQIATILLAALVQQGDFATGTNLSVTTLQADQKTIEVLLAGGSDGLRPQPSAYEGVDTDPKRKTGLKALQDIPDISIVAAPGHTAWPNPATAATLSLTVANLLISHCEEMRYCIAVLDSIEGQMLPDIRGFRAQIDSTRAALYYPFVRILDPVTQTEINLPPSGFITGIYARSDILYGVHKSPANEVIRGALGFEVMINKGQQDVLNPEGINCSRFFEGRGYRVWGARTATSDPEWKYVNVRRYFLYLERSIDKGTQWCVFENNGDALWANVRRTIEDFLFNEWKSGHLFGTKPEEAYFVRCDRTTMTQNDFDNGRLVCLIGVSPLRPAEFVIFRIGQKTADARS